MQIENLTKDQLRKRITELEASGAFYQQLFKTAPYGILVTEATKGTIISINPAFTHLTGYSPDELLGNKLWEAGPFKVIEARRISFGKPLEKGLIKHEGLSLQTKDGRQISVILISNSYKVKGKAMILYSILDISEHKHADIEARKEADTWYQALFEGANDAIFIMVRDRLVECNQKSLEIFGFKNKKDIIGNTLWEFSPKQQPDGRDSREKASELLDSAYEGKPQRFYWQHVRADGTLFDAEVSLSSIAAGGQTFVQVLVRDITERKKVKKLLMEKHFKEDPVPENIEGLLEKLRTYQIELEIQNENLKQAQIQLQESLNKYSDLYDFSPSAYFIIGEDGMIKEVNLTGVSLLRIDRRTLLMKPFRRFVHPEDQPKYYKLLKNTLEDDSTVKEELRIVREDGSESWVSMSSVALRRETSREIRTAIIDITDRKQIEFSLQQKTEELDNFFDLSLDLLLIANKNGTIRKMNREWEEVLGYKRKELIGKKGIDYIHPDDLKIAYAASDIILSGRPLKNFECRVRAKDGSYRWIEWNSLLVGRSVYTGARDITKRKKQEEELKRLNRTLKAVSNVNQAMIRATDEIQLLKDACRIIAEDCGYSLVWIGYAEEDEKKTVHPVASFGFEEEYLKSLSITWADEANGRGPTGTAIRTGEPNLCKNLKTRPCLDSCLEEALRRGYTSSLALPMFAEGKILGAISLCSSIPDSFSEEEVNLLKEISRDLEYGVSAIRLHFSNMKAQEDLRKSEERLHALVTASSEVLYSMSPDWSEMLQLHSRGFLSETERPNRTWLQKYIPPDDQPRVTAIINETIRTKNIFELEHRVRRADGTLGWIFSRAVPLIGASGEIIEWFGAANDITGRKQYEDALKDNEERYRLTLESMPDAVCIQSIKDSRYLFVNHAFKKLTGFTEEEIIGKTPFDLGLPVEIEDQDAYMKCVRESTDSNRLDIRHRMKDGKILDTLVSCNMISYKGEDCSVVVISDITDFKRAEDERKRLEIQLAQSQKMEALGTLAGGIAHDFNNLLTAIMGYTEIARMNIRVPDKVDINLRNALKACRRAKDLVSQVLSFSRHAGGEFTPLTLSYTIEEFLNMLRSVIPSNIEIRRNLEVQGKVKADPTQINQMMMNLSINAAQAMGINGGVLEVDLDKADTDEATALALEIIPGSYFRLRVKDTGPGIPPEILSRIFEPYFTTKKEKGSSGMGLAIVHGIVKRHGGAITCQSSPVKGTVFEVYLPEAAIKEKKIQEAINVEIPTGTERILFVDDEKALVEVAENLLGSLGYKMTASTSSIDALELFRKDPTRFDLVVTDMTMPGMMGDKLAQEILKIRPDIPIIMYTGYSEFINEEQAKSLGIQKFMLKPFEIEDLAKNIRHELDRSKSNHGKGK
jgi:PAS domain S-box-containing protein